MQSCKFMFKACLFFSLYALVLVGLLLLFASDYYALGVCASILLFIFLVNVFKQWGEATGTSNTLSMSKYSCDQNNSPIFDGAQRMGNTDQSTMGALNNAQVLAVTHRFYIIMAERQRYTDEGIALASMFKVGNVYATNYAPLFDVLMHEIFTLASEPQYKNEISYPVPASCMRKAALQGLMCLDGIAYSTDVIYYVSQCIDRIKQLQPDLDIDDPDGFAIGTLTTFTLNLQEFIDMYQQGKLT